MVRLYEYADSNSKSGYFLRGRSEEGNTTFQVSELGEQLFDKLGYEPGTVNETRGPRIPDRLHWGMFEIGWVYTEGSEISSPISLSGEMELESEEVEFSDEEANQVAEFLGELSGEREEVEELADLLDLDQSLRTQDAWAISELNRVLFEGQLKICLEESINSEDGLEWTYSIEYLTETFEGIEKAVIGVQMDHQLFEREQFYHAVYICPEHGFEKIATAARSKLDWKKRKLLERHRQKLIEAVIDVARDLGVNIGPPTADVDLVTDDEMEIFE